MTETIIIGGRTNKTTTTLKEILEKKEKEEFAIAELEKIKTKMEVIHNRYAINFQGFSMSVAQECIDIIDNEIAELKGENNE